MASMWLGTVTPIAMWATRRDRSQEDKATEGGSRDETRRDWRIRWDERIANASTLNLEVVDGATFTVTNMVEVTEQRGGSAEPSA